MSENYKYEIRQDGEIMLASDNETAIMVIWNNLTRKNKMSKAAYRDYIQFVAMDMGGFHGGPIELWIEGRLFCNGEINIQ